MSCEQKWHCEPSSGRDPLLRGLGGRSTNLPSARQAESTFDTRGPLLSIRRSKSLVMVLDYIVCFDICIWVLRDTHMWGVPACQLLYHTQHPHHTHRHGTRPWYIANLSRFAQRSRLLLPAQLQRSPAVQQAAARPSHGSPGSSRYQTTSHPADQRVRGSSSRFSRTRVNAAATSMTLLSARRKLSGWRMDGGNVVSLLWVRGN